MEPFRLMLAAAFKAEWFGGVVATDARIICLRRESGKAGGAWAALV